MYFIKIKHFLRVVLLLGLIIPSGFVLAGSNAQGLSQSATPTPVSQQTPIATVLAPTQVPGILQTEPAPLIPDSTEILSFEDFGFEELTLRGPFAASGYYFDLPPTWRMTVGAQLRLVIDTFYTGTTSNSEATLDSVY